MFRAITLCAALLSALVLMPTTGPAQSDQQGWALVKEARALLDQAKSRADLEKAAVKYEEALKLCERARSDKCVGVAADQLGLIYRRLSQDEKALEYYEKSLEIMRRAGDLRLEGNLLNSIGQIYQAWSRYQKALEYYEKSLVMRQKAHDGYGVGQSLNNIAGVYDRLGQYAKALEYYERSLTIRRKVGDTRGEGVTLHNIGSVYSAWDQYGKALEYYETSLVVMKRLGDFRDFRVEGMTMGAIGRVYYALGQYAKALEYYEKSLASAHQIGDVRDEGWNLLNMGNVYYALGQYAKALEHYEKSLAIRQKVGDPRGESESLNRIGSVYFRWGQHQKASEYLQKSLAIRQKVGDAAGQGASLNNMGMMHYDLGQYAKAMDYYEKSLTVSRSVGDERGEGLCLGNIGDVYANQGLYPKALEYYEKCLAVQKRIGVPPGGIEDSIGNVYLCMGDLEKAESIFKRTGIRFYLGKLALAKSEFREAKTNFEGYLRQSVQNQGVQGLFAVHTGLGLAYEGLKENDKAATHFKTAIEVIEQIREGLTEAQLANFYDVQVWNIPRITPYEGLARVLSKAGKQEQSFKEAEGTKARAFAESLSRRSGSAGLDVPKKVVDQDTEINNKLATLNQGLQKAYEKGSKEAIESFEKQVKEARQERDRHVSKLRTEYPLFAATKYPQPMGIEHAALKDNEWVLEYEVTEPGICIYLVQGRKMVKTLFKPIERKQIESLVRKFREPLEVVPGKDSISDKLKSFDLAAGKKLSDLLLADILPDLPEGKELIIVPDECLSVLPFEMLVLNSGGEIKTDGKIPIISGGEFLGDRNPISYYQSVTALTLARTLQKKGKAADRLLVVADPVFQLKDQRAQNAKSTKIAEAEKKFYSDLMTTMEQPDGGGLRFNRLALTGDLAKTLSDDFKGQADTFTGLEASKENLLKKIAPQMDRYGTIVFATHGYFGNKIPGIMEPILCLTMVPEGTDGFLRMSEVMGLKLNADIVALTACQTGIGRNIPGEGTMGMGRAFQYAGARSVLMSLWNVEQQSSVKLVQSFFRHVKEGKKKLEALRLAREEIRKDGYDHPFFWAPFILVGEVD